MFADTRLSLRILAAIGAATAVFATLLPWYSFDVVLPVPGIVHIFAVTTTLWGLTTLAPILIVLAAVVALALAMLGEGPITDAVIGLIGAAIVVYAVARCLNLPALGISAHSGAKLIPAITQVEGGPFVELSAGAMLTLGALVDLLASGVSTTGARRSVPARGRRVNPTAAP
jgi:hypothetical protein